MNEYPELNNESYILHDRVMTPLAAQLERKPRRDHDKRRGHHSTSSSSAFDQPSSSYLNNDDDNGNNEGTSHFPPRPLNPQPLQSHPSLDITLSLSPITPLDHIHDTPSPPSQPQPQPPIMDELLLVIENMEDKIEGLANGRDFYSRNDHRGYPGLLTRRYEESSGQDQITMVLLPSSFLKPLYPDIMDMIIDQDIEHTISPSPDYPLMNYLSGRTEK
ncbi:hypothetical protein Tco_1171108 [Tanacetum coccineum]